MDSRANIIGMAQEMVRMLSEPERERDAIASEMATGGMNRKARRTWYAQQRARSKKGKAP